VVVLSWQTRLLRSPRGQQASPAQIPATNGVNSQLFRRRFSSTPWNAANISAHGVQRRCQSACKGRSTCVRLAARACDRRWGPENLDTVFTEPGRSPWKACSFGTRRNHKVPSNGGRNHALISIRRKGPYCPHRGEKPVRLYMQQAPVYTKRCSECRDGGYGGGSPQSRRRADMRPRELRPADVTGPSNLVFLASTSIDVGRTHAIRKLDSLERRRPRTDVHSAPRSVRSGVQRLFFRAACVDGLEGIVARRRSETYRRGLARPG
jgi:hypothetical protein